MQYELSSEVAKVAERVIKQHHPDLYSKRIHYLMLDKKDDKGSSVSKKSKGHQVFAEIKVLSSDAAFLISGEARTDDNGPMPVVVLKVYPMPWMNLKPETREALIDSQLCRLIYDDETGRPSIMEYDAKLFNANLAHYGAWNDDIEKVLKATKDLPLFEENGKPKVQKAEVAGNGKDAVTVNIYTDRECTSCGKMESTDSGLCLKCAAKRIEKNLGADVKAKKRGRSATAGAN